jgi:hypothetical protein
MANLIDKMEEGSIAFIYVVVLVGSVGFAFWATVNTTAAGLDTTQLLAWGLVLTFLVLGIAFGFIGHFRRVSKSGKR